MPSTKPWGHREYVLQFSLVPTGCSLVGAAWHFSLSLASFLTWSLHLSQEASQSIHFECVHVYEGPCACMDPCLWKSQDTLHCFSLGVRTDVSLPRPGCGTPGSMSLPPQPEITIAQQWQLVFVTWLLETECNALCLQGKHFVLIAPALALRVPNMLNALSKSLPRNPALNLFVYQWQEHPG